MNDGELLLNENRWKEILEKLRVKFLPKVSFDYQICREKCHHCEDELGCTKWKKKMENEQIRKKIQKVQKLEKNIKELNLELSNLSEESEEKRKEIEIINKKTSETKKLKIVEWEKIKNSRPEKFIVRLREVSDIITIAHEFTHSFLAFHYIPSDEHHSEPDKNGSNDTSINSFSFYSLLEFFLEEIY